jgi:hypothetical protein
VESDSKYLQECGIYAHKNREFFDYIVENNQKRLIFADITEKWYTWRVFTGVIGNCEEFISHNEANFYECFSNSMEIFTKICGFVVV